MSDDLNKKIKQITDMLGQENIPDNVKGLLSILGGASSSEGSSPKPGEPSAEKAEKAVTSDKHERSELEENMEMIRKVKKVMDRLNNNSDPRIHLLTAIKPFLNNTRQTRIANCIRILQMSSLTGLMDDHDFFGKP